MKRSIKDLVDLEGKRVLLRADFNVPLDKYGKVQDKTKIVEEIPTIKFLVDRGAKVILCSHLGRPNGFEIGLSMWQISLILMQYFPGKVQFAQKTVGDVVKEQVKCLENGSILLLENLRFHKEEEDNDPKFAKDLASLADIYVNDAFGVCHRKHASTYGVARLLPNAIGFLVEKELNAIQDALEKPIRPLVTIFGGLKVEDKIKVLTNAVDISDTILIGGAMAYPFLVAKWVTVGQSYCTNECVAVASEVLNKAKLKGTNIILPVDHVAVRAGDKKHKPFITEVLDSDMVGCDIGPKTVELFEKEIVNAGEVIWNGPLGKYEDQIFRYGTKKVAEIVANSKCYSLVGGGDSLSAINMAGVAKKISHLSTGGGATLKMLEGKSLPAIDVIQERIV